MNLAIGSDSWLRGCVCVCVCSVSDCVRYRHYTHVLTVAKEMTRRSHDDRWSYSDPAAYVHDVHTEVLVISGSVARTSDSRCANFVCTTAQNCCEIVRENHTNRSRESVCFLCEMSLGFQVNDLLGVCFSFGGKRNIARNKMKDTSLPPISACRIFATKSAALNRYV